jgi:hypothetical protein
MAKRRTDNAIAKRRRIDKYNGQKKKDRQIQWLNEEG